MPAFFSKTTKRESWVGYAPARALAPKEETRVCRGECESSVVERGKTSDGLRDMFSCTDWWMKVMLRAGVGV